MLMLTFTYRCSVRGVHTHAWIADDVQARSGANEFISVRCTACQQAHLINPRTGEIAAAPGDTGMLQS
jgi:hypothetical protein